MQGLEVGLGGAGEPRIRAVATQAVAVAKEEACTLMRRVTGLGRLVMKHGVWYLGIRGRMGMP